jgi:hypothetical protein
LINAIIKREQQPQPGVENIERIDRVPEYAKIADAMQALEHARTGKEADRRRLPEAAQNPRRLTAAQILAGETESGASVAGEIAARDVEIATLSASIAAKADELDNERSKLSFELCRRFAIVNAGQHRAVLDALRSLRAALRDQLALHGAITAAGYAVNEAAMPSFFLAGLWQALSDPRHPDGAAGLLQQFIESRGL